MNSIRDQDACREAARLLRQGQPVGTYIRGVCGLWADGNRQDGLDSLYGIKGEERGSRPVGTALASSAFIERLNGDQVAPEVRQLIFDQRELVDHLGSLCFIRAPMKAEAARTLPERLYSKTPEDAVWLQNWLPEGCSSAAAWMRALGESGVHLPVATSMNVSGEPEIVDPLRGEEFCQAHGVPIFLDDPQSPERARGSFPILQVDGEGIKLLREGHFPAEVFRSLLSAWEFRLSDYQRAQFPLIEIPAKVAGLASSPADLRQDLLEYMDG